MTYFLLTELLIYYIISNFVCYLLMFKLITNFYSSCSFSFLYIFDVYTFDMYKLSVQTISRNWFESLIFLLFKKILCFTDLLIKKSNLRQKKTGKFLLSLYTYIKNKSQFFNLYNGYTMLKVFTE